MQQWQMNNIFKQKWIKALRSGKYKQGRAYLASSITTKKRDKLRKLIIIKEYCCLGVACHLAQVPFSAMVEVAIPLDLYSSFDDDEGEARALLPSVLLHDMVDGSLVNILISMNDGDEENGIARQSFEEIADYIENNVKGIT